MAGLWGEGLFENKGGRSHKPWCCGRRMQRGHWGRWLGARREGDSDENSGLSSFQSRRLDCHSPAILGAQTGGTRKCHMWERFAEEEWPRPQTDGVYVDQGARAACRVQALTLGTTPPPAICGILVLDPQMTVMMTAWQGGSKREDKCKGAVCTLDYSLDVNHDCQSRVDGNPGVALASARLRFGSWCHHPPAGWLQAGG